jgi:hypothetical protein
VIRFLVFLALLGGFVWFGASVRLGKHTLFGHVSRIWSSDEANDLKEGAGDKLKSEETKRMIDKAKDKAGPAVDRVKRGAKAAYDEARRDPDAGRKPAPAGNN